MTRTQARAVARRIFRRLDEDIRDRHTLKHDWRSIEDHVMREIRSAWETIIAEEIEARNRPKKVQRGC